MKKFDLFKIHSKEDRPKGWIWVYLDCSILKNSYLKILKYKPQNIIAREINKKLNCGFSTIGKHLIRLKYSKRIVNLPLPVVIELVKIINPKIKNKIIDDFEYFICKNNVTKQKTKAIKRLNENISKIVGIHLADGCLSKTKTHGYNICISDGKKDNIRLCKEWIRETFLIEPKIRTYVRFKNNYWRCEMGNKIIGRYLENIFNIKSGKKFDIAKEPKIIKNSGFKIRKAFAKGVLMFDGGVKSTGMVALTSMSKQLIDDVEEILKLDGIKVKKKYNDKKKSWLIESRSGRDKKYLKKWLDYFEKGTWKYNRLKFFLEDKKYNINELSYLFPKHYLSKIYLKNVYNIMNKIKKGKIGDIMLNIKNLKVAPVTVYKYLYLLEKSGLIYKELEEHITDKNGWRESIYYFKK